MQDPNRTKPLKESWNSYGRSCRRWWDVMARCIRGSSAHSSPEIARSAQREGFGVGRSEGLLTPKFLGFRACRNGAHFEP